MKPKTEIKPGQVWREKRSLDSTGWQREVLVMSIKDGCVEYQPSNYIRGTCRVYRPIKEPYFRAGYELLTDAPTEAQKEQRGEEG